MAGGLGNDTYIVDDAGDVVTEALNAGTDLVQTGLSYTLGDNVERLRLVGTGNVNATGNGLENRLFGNDGNNRLDGLGGADIMAGGLGNDTYVVDHAGDSITEAASAGTDLVESSITWTLGNNLERLRLTGTANSSATGNSLDNRLFGNDGANTLNGLGGADEMQGGLGNDTYVVDSVGDVVTEAAGAGTDVVESSITYTLGANLERLRLTGTANINAIGNTLDNRLYGNDGNNVVNGGGGADQIYGRLGVDTLVGGAGADGFYFDTALGGGNIDKINDFNVADDTIFLENAIFAALPVTGVLAPGAFVTGAAAGDANDRIIYNAGTGALLYDADGNGAGAAVQFATLTVGLALTNADFTII
jgi:Ca2+-binding RTX toxin-like protein